LPDAPPAGPVGSDDPDVQLNRAVTKVAGWLRTIIPPDQVVELRALKVANGAHPCTVAGTYRGIELDLLARQAQALSGRCQGVYYTLNPLRPEKLVLRLPRAGKVGQGDTAKDVDVLARRVLLVDVDPVRVPGFEKCSATDAEKAAARETAQKVREYLTGEGWPAPVVGDSGNGYHLEYLLAEPLPVVLPLKDDDPIRRVLYHLAERFDSSAATIDRAVFNPARIIRCPGTRTCKGEPTPDRPHRRARLLEIPEPLVGVTGEQLLAVAARYVATSSNYASNGRPRPSGDDLARRVRAYLATIPRPSRASGARTGRSTPPAASSAGST
jgi:hypothetical protein